MLAILVVTTGMLSKWDVEKDTGYIATHAVTPVLRGDTYVISSDEDMVL